MDIEMECKDAGIRATGEILSENPQIKIIILTVYEEDELNFLCFPFRRLRLYSKECFRRRNSSGYYWRLS